MLLPRFIPLILVLDKGMYITTGFGSPQYVGDPLNAIKIFNDAGADELFLIDLQAAKHGIDYNYLEMLASEAFMPVSYGGGIRATEDVARVVRCGIEKVIVNTAAFRRSFLEQAIKQFGSSTIVASVDYNSGWFSGEQVYTNRGKTRVGMNVLQACQYVQEMGVGEIVLHSISRDGMRTGYDWDMLQKVARVVHVPLIILGGASGYKDLTLAVNYGASGAAAGSLFAFAGPQKSVLINYPAH